MGERKLRNCEYCQGALKLKEKKNKWGVKRGLHAPQTVTQLYFNGLY